jgi:hypothetical protein
MIARIGGGRSLLFEVQAVCSEPIVNTSVLQRRRPVLQITIPLANRIDLRMGHLSY